MIHHDPVTLVLGLTFALIGAAAKSVRDGGGFFDNLLLGGSKSQPAQTDFEFKIVFFMIGAIAFGLVAYCMHRASVTEQIYRPEISVQSVPIAQPKSTHRTPKKSTHTRKKVVSSEMI